MALSTINGDVHVNGTLSSKIMNPPANSVGNSAVKAAAAIAASKLEHQWNHFEEVYVEGTTIVALASRMIHTVTGVTGEVVAIEGWITTQATGADRTVTVDLEKSTAGGAFATILSTTVDITNSTTIRTAVAGILSDGNLVVGDMLRLVVTVAGSASAQAAGLFVSVVLREDAA